MHLISKGVLEAYSEYTHTERVRVRVQTLKNTHTDKHAETNKTDRSSTQGERDQEYTTIFSRTSTAYTHTHTHTHTHSPVNVATRPLEWVHPPLGQTHYCHWAEEFGIYYRTPEKKGRCNITIKIAESNITDHSVTV